ncbi:Vps17p [Sugiyamaella lignohabitans]|uniref:Vacuolar protein sorting-associated protein 17 n=1 Tax=Sugiyamaella lignohabitans TaxID=796027 RepID=A0A167C8F1_9ASCO|nr:Vps17p [Sugiyamaella lignohabitans]ANB11353.1 Vps17p [Sugiyamaella lignohabitans]
MSGFYDDSAGLHSNPFAGQDDEATAHPFASSPREPIGSSLLDPSNEPYGSSSIHEDDNDGNNGHDNDHDNGDEHGFRHDETSENIPGQEQQEHENDHGDEHAAVDSAPDSGSSTANASGSGATVNQTATDNAHVKPTGSTTSGNTAGSAASGAVSSSSTGVGKRPKKYKLALKVTGLERQGKKDPIIHFDAYTTLPRFRTTTFRDIRRTHHEFIKFFEHLNGANPECFVPAVPPSVTSAGAGTEEDEIKVKANIQTWLDRVSSNPILARDEEFIYFIEADFGYSPVIKRKPPATGLARKAMKQLQPPYDEVIELHELRPLIKRVYQLGLEANTKLDKVTKTRRSLGIALTDFGTKTAAASSLESHQGMINMWRKLGKTLTNIGDNEAVRATAEAASFGDGINWVASNAYVAKEALTNRHLLMRELIKAQANTKSKHQVAVRVKGSTNINPIKVDEAINALEDATHVEEQLTNKVRRVSDNMLLEKRALLANIEHDVFNYIGEYALRIIECERRALATWESIRADVRAVDSNGGLSRLGRESTPANRRTALAQSQGAKGDAWSGDRQGRAADLSKAAEKLLYRDKPSSTDGALSNGRQTVDDEEEDLLRKDEETVVDARNAASLLAGSTF